VGEPEVNVDEAKVFVSEAATLDLAISPTDVGHLDEIARGWAEVCKDVPYAFAHQVLITWTSVYHIRASQVRGLWEQQQKTAARNTYSETACAWERVCRCTHTECVHGQMAGDLALEKITVQGDRGQTRDRETLVVKWCPRCWEARNIIRSDQGKEPRTLGDLTP
jgi:hypothetical protein